MAALFSKPPKPDPIRVPDRSDAEIQTAAAEQRKQLLTGKGTSYLTGGIGVPNAGLSFGGSRLLGGT